MKSPFTDSGGSHKSIRFKGLLQNAEFVELNFEVYTTTNQILGVGRCIIDGREIFIKGGRNHDDPNKVY